LSILIQKTKGYDLCASVKLRKGERSPLADLLADIL
jgi:predicted ribonuclease YlaK